MISMEYPCFAKCPATMALVGASMRMITLGGAGGAVGFAMGCVDMLSIDKVKLGE